MMPATEHLSSYRDYEPKHRRIPPRRGRLRIPPNWVALSRNQEIRIDRLAEHYRPCIPTLEERANQIGAADIKLKSSGVSAHRDGNANGQPPQIFRITAIITKFARPVPPTSTAYQKLPPPWLG